MVEVDANMNVVYDCHIREVMGYAERGYCFLRGDDALLRRASRSG